MYDNISVENHKKNREGYLPLISELNQRLNQLEATNKLIAEHFYQTFHNSGIGMAIIELDGTFREVNEKLAEMTGYSRAELEGLKTFQELSDIDGMRNDVEQMMSLIHGDSDSYQTYKKICPKTGDQIPVILNISLIRNADDEPLYFVSQVIPVNDIANLAVYFEQRG